MAKVIFYFLISLGIILCISSIHYAKKNNINERFAEIKKFNPTKKESADDLIKEIIKNNEFSKKSLKPEVSMNNIKSNVPIKSNIINDKTSNNKNLNDTSNKKDSKEAILNGTEILDCQDNENANNTYHTEDNHEEYFNNTKTELLNEATEVLDLDVTDVTEVLIEKTEILTMEEEGELN